MTLTGQQSLHQLRIHVPGEKTKMMKRPMVLSYSVLTAYSLREGCAYMPFTNRIDANFLEEKLHDHCFGSPILIPFGVF